MAQDTNLNTLIINKMTKAQYNAAEKSDSELYMVTDETYYTADEVDQKLANVSANLTGYAKETYVDQKVADLVGSSPDTLNTLNELASALGNDPNFATTITNQLAQKADKSYVDGEVTKLQTDIDNNTSNITTLQESIASKANTADLAQVAKTGSFTDLNNIPSIPSVETTATENSTNAISSGYVYTLEDKLTNGTGGYKVMTAEYADNVPVISTNISTDAESDIKTASPKAVKSYVDGNVVANPTLTGSETSLTSIGIGGTNFSVGSSSGGGLDFSNVEEIYSYHSLYSASGWKRLVNFNFVPFGTFKAFFVLAGVSTIKISDSDMNDDSALIDKIKYSTYGYQLLPNFDSITYSTMLGKGLNDATTTSLGGNQLRLTIDATAKKIYLDVNGTSNSSEHNYAMKIYGIK